jgi:uncharacterized membrane protein
MQETIDILIKRPRLEAAQYLHLKDNVATALAAFEKNSGKKLKAKDRLTYEHLLLAGAICALDTLGYDAPPMFGVAMMTNQSILDK